MTYQRKWPIVLLATTISSFTTPFMGSSVNVALPAIGPFHDQPAAFTRVGFHGNRAPGRSQPTVELEVPKSIPQARAGAAFMDWRGESGGRMLRPLGVARKREPPAFGGGVMAGPICRV